MTRTQSKHTPTHHRHKARSLPHRQGPPLPPFHITRAGGGGACRLRLGRKGGGGERLLARQACARKGLGDQRARGMPLARSSFGASPEGRALALNDLRTSRAATCPSSAFLSLAIIRGSASWRDPVRPTSMGACPSLSRLLHNVARAQRV